MSTCKHYIFVFCTVETVPRTVFHKWTWVSFLALSLALHRPPPATTGSPQTCNEINYFLYESKRLDAGVQMGETVKESLWTCRGGGWFEGFQSSAPHSIFSLPAPSWQTALARHSLLTGSPGPSIKCRSQAAQGAAVFGFSLLLTSLCRRLASAEKCPPGHWPLRARTAQEEGFHRGLEGASQTQRGQQLCCQNTAPGQWAWEQSLYSPQ